MLSILLAVGLLSAPEESTPARRHSVAVPPESHAETSPGASAASGAGSKAGAKAEKKAALKAKAGKTAEKSEAEPESESAKEAKPESKPETKPVPRPIRPRPVARRRAGEPTPAEVHKRLAEAEAKALRLTEENAKLQQEIAKAQGLPASPITTPDAAVAELKSGNSRFVAGKRVRTLLSMQDEDLRAALNKGQAPFAVIVTCSDSRVADNLLFDQELGRLFTIREAGNSPDIQGIASAEYAVEHLGTKLVVVLGHTSCGAIKAIAEAHGKPLPGNLWSLQAATAGLLESTLEDPNAPASEYHLRLSETNAQRQAQAMLARSEILREGVAAGRLKVLPAVYDLASGAVKFLEAPMADEKPKAHH
ncbi:MAG TPA: carbonic anhydrase [Holophaga sp.]|nr:carbonic anhydrase [Holophaga sp.]